MANEHTTLTSLFNDIADAIREKTGGTDMIVADDFPQAISEIPTGASYIGTLAHGPTFIAIMGWNVSRNNM